MRAGQPGRKCLERRARTEACSWPAFAGAQAARQALTETEVPDAITLSRSKVFSFEGAHEATALAPIVAIGDGCWH